MTNSKILPMRSMLVASKDHKLIQWDLSQAETWIVAYLANSKTMKDSLHFGDIHTDTAAGIFNCEKENVTKVQRFLGKKGNHELSYGATHFMLAQSINAESDRPPFITVSIPEAKDIYNGWHRVNWEVKANFWSYIEECLGVNRTLITPYGRFRVFYEAWGTELFKTAYAYIPQSSIADHLNGKVHPQLQIKGGLLEVKREFVNKGLFNIVNQSHDSFIAEVHDDKCDDVIEPVTNLIHRPLVINGEEFTIPVDVEIGERWGELKKVKVAA